MDEENNTNVCEVCDNDPCTCEEDLNIGEDNVPMGDEFDIPEME